MKIDKIILELKEILKDDDMIKLSNLISKLEQEYKESKFINNVNDKTKINTIKKILDNAGNDSSRWRLII